MHHHHRQRDPGRATLKFLVSFVVCMVIVAVAAALVIEPSVSRRSVEVELDARKVIPPQS